MLKIQEDATQNDEEQVLDDGWHPRTHFDSTRLIVEDDSDSDSDGDVEEVPEWGDLEDEDLQEHLVDLARAQGDDLADEDWLPPKLLKKRRKLEQIKKRTFLIISQ